MYFEGKRIDSNTNAEKKLDILIDEMCQHIRLYVYLPLKQQER